MPVIFATDFSARATRAGDVAARLAKACGERLVVLHVTAPGDHGDDLEHEVERLDKDVVADAVLRHGAVVPEIASFVDHVKPRFLVVGAQGLGMRAAVGTVATSLAARLPVPVFVIRDERMMPFFDRHEALKVVVPDALDAMLVGAREALVELSHFGRVHATILHASARDASPSAADERILKAELLDAVGPIPNVELQAMVCSGEDDVDVRLLEEIRARQPDLVVCGTHQRHAVQRVFLGAVSSFLMSNAPCSVLVAPIPVTGLN